MIKSYVSLRVLWIFSFKKSTDHQVQYRVFSRKYEQRRRFVWLFLVLSEEDLSKAKIYY